MTRRLGPRLMRPPVNPCICRQPLALATDAIVVRYEIVSKWTANECMPR